MLKLFFIGFAMGTADLIPGISGGTVAFLAGIYERLLHELKSLSFSQISWRFFLPLGSGIGLALLGCAQLFSWLLASWTSLVFAFFFGIVFTSTVQYLQRELPRSWAQIGWLCCGGTLGFFLAGYTQQCVALHGFWGLMVAGSIAAMALLLPGTSGCYMLHILGVYPLVLGALTSPWRGSALQILIPVALGIGLGVLGSARLISYLIKRYQTLLIPLLIGLMFGGLRALWVFTWPIVGHTVLVACLGVVLILTIQWAAHRLLNRQTI